MLVLNREKPLSTTPSSGSNDAVPLLPVVVLLVGWAAPNVAPTALQKRRQQRKPLSQTNLLCRHAHQRPGSQVRAGASSLQLKHESECVKRVDGPAMPTCQQQQLHGDHSG
jgi:hypothetical protein